jgi:hypothetical protein
MELQVSHEIELDDEVFDYLKANAEPWVDTPNTVLRRLLGMGRPTTTTATTTASKVATSSTSSRGHAPGRSTRANAAKLRPKRKRAAAGTLLPEDRYERPLLKVLVDVGGQAPYRDVVEAVGRELKDELMPADFENLNSGTVRWQSRLQFVRLRLIERGYLDRKAPRGVWGITDAGREALAGGEGS